MRILVVEYTSLVGGAQRSLLELLCGLIEDHELVLACPAGPLQRLVREHGIDVVSIPASQATFKLHPRHTITAIRGMGAAARRVRNLIGFLRPDVVHANSVRAGLIAIPACGRRTPLVVHCRDVLPASGLSRAVRGLTIARAQRVVAISRHVAVSFAGPRWERRGVCVVDNAVDLERFDPFATDRASARSELGLGPGDDPVVALIAQITPWKGQDLAIRALAELRCRHVEAVLLIVGEAKFVSAGTSNDNRAYERHLHDLVAALGLGAAVRFLGEREDPERILAASDVLVVTSTVEPFGRTLIEAMAMGVPVIATAHGGPSEIVREGSDGHLVGNREPPAWADAIEGVLTWPIDRRNGSREYAAGRFSRARHAQVMTDVLDEGRRRFT